MSPGRVVQDGFIPAEPVKDHKMVKVPVQDARAYDIFPQCFKLDVITVCAHPVPSRSLQDIDGA